MIPCTSRILLLSLPFVHSFCFHFGLDITPICHLADLAASSPQVLFGIVKASWHTMKALGACKCRFCFYISPEFYFGFFLQFTFILILFQFMFNFVLFLFLFPFHATLFWLQFSLYFVLVFTFIFNAFNLTFK